MSVYTPIAIGEKFNGVVSLCLDRGSELCYGWIFRPKEIRAEPCDGGGPSGERPKPDGLWKGLFSYPQLFEPTSFVAILIEQGARFSGTTHEPCIRGPHLGGLLYAMIEGNREGSIVSFIKTYDGTGGWSHSVAYEGLLNGDGTEIEGRWKTLGWSGKFLMLRPTAKDAGAQEEAVARKATEPVGRP